MQRNHSFTSLSTTHSSRYPGTDSMRDTPTESLMGDSRFARKSRKEPHSKMAYNFPNGEVFTPRTAPSRRNRPAKISPDYHRGVPRSMSMVSMPSPQAFNTSPQLPSHPSPQHGPSPTGNVYLTRSNSFTNAKQKSKQNLAAALRSNKLDTPTNINIPLPTTVSPQAHPHHSYSLTNNRYTENSSNIVRSEQPCPAAIDPPRFTRSDSSPSSVSNYNLNRSNSNTPQTSFSGSDNMPADVSVKSRSSSESIASSNNGREILSLTSIRETSAVQTFNMNHAEASMVSDPGYDHCSNSRHNLSESIKRQSTASSFESASEFPNNESPREDTKSDIQSITNTRTGDERMSHEEAQSGQEVPPGSSESSSNNGSPNDSSSKIVDSSNSTSSDEEPSDEYHSGPSNSLSANEDDMLSDEASIEIENDIISIHSPHNEHDATSTRSAIGSNMDSTLERDPEDISESQKIHQTPVPMKPTGDLPEPTIVLEPVANSNYVQVGQSRNRIHDCSEPTETQSGPLTSSVPPTPISKDSPIEYQGNSNPPTPISKDLSNENSNSSLQHVTNSPSPLATQSQRVISPLKKSSDFSESQKSVGLDGCHDTATDTDSCNNLNLPSKNTKEKPSQPVKSMLLTDEQLMLPSKSSLLDRRNHTLRPIKSNFSLGNSPRFDPLVSQESFHSPQTKHPSSTSDAQQSGTLNQLSQGTVQGRIEDVTNKISPDMSLVEADKDSGKFDFSDLYSPAHVGKFLLDTQQEVPPRGDVAVQGESIKVHKRSTSSVSSFNSSKIKSNKSISEPGSPFMRDNALQELPNGTRLLSQSRISPKDARYSMLAVVDVDYDKLLPPTPTRNLEFSKQASISKSEHLQHIEDDAEMKDISMFSTAPSPSIGSKDSNRKKFKKYFNMFSNGSKQSSDSKKLKSKSSISSFKNSLASNRKDGVENNSAFSGIENTSGNNKEFNGYPNSLKDRKKKFLSNLRMTTGLKLYDVPSPAYSVREKPPAPTTSAESVSEESEVTFGLPDYDIGEDTFDDVLLRFEQVEIDAEKEVSEMRATKNVHDYFMKDDELTKAQIVDQQRQDIQYSNESLPGKYDQRNTSTSNVMSLDIDGNLGQHTPDFVKEAEPHCEFPPNGEVSIITLDSKNIQAALNKPLAFSKSYLKYARQFSDFDEIEIKLSGFDPSVKSEIEVKSPARSSIMGKTSNRGTRNVTFSNQISVSETFAPYTYKRHNKSVTQYYLTEFSEINRIKNELNAFKCHEMLVHEKSQMNTQFFY